MCYTCDRIHLELGERNVLKSWPHCYAGRSGGPIRGRTFTTSSVRVQGGILDMKNFILKLIWLPEVLNLMRYRIPVLELIIVGGCREGKGGVSLFCRPHRY